MTVLSAETGHQALSKSAHGTQDGFLALVHVLPLSKESDKKDPFSTPACCGGGKSGYLPSMARQSFKPIRYRERQYFRSQVLK